MEDNDDADLFRCAVCGMSEGDSSNFTQSSLQTNAAVGCGHQFCMSCVERELSRRKVFPCPICETSVKRVTLSTRSLDDIQCEKDTNWRRRVRKVYNKVENDFPNSLEAYNNYLEEVEDIIWAIVNEEPNAEDMKNKVKRYELEHKSEIATRQSQRADEDRSIADRIAAEQRDAERRKRQFLEEEKVIAAAKRRFKQESLQVSLGEREEVSKDLVAAQKAGYRNEILKAHRNKKAQNEMVNRGPRVREPVGGYRNVKIDRNLYLKRQAAGGGIPSGSIMSQDKNWNLAVSTLFCAK